VAAAAPNQKKRIDLGATNWGRKDQRRAVISDSEDDDDHGTEKASTFGKPSLAARDSLKRNPREPVIIGGRFKNDKPPTPLIKKEPIVGLSGTQRMAPVNPSIKRDSMIMAASQPMLSQSSSSRPISHPPPLIKTAVQNDVRSKVAEWRNDVKPAEGYRGASSVAVAAANARQRYSDGPPPAMKRDFPSGMIARPPPQPQPQPQPPMNHHHYADKMNAQSNSRPAARPLSMLDSSAAYSVIGPGKYSAPAPKMGMHLASYLEDQAELMTNATDEMPSPSMMPGAKRISVNPDDTMRPKNSMETVSLSAVSSFADLPPPATQASMMEIPRATLDPPMFAVGQPPHPHHPQSSSTLLLPKGRGSSEAGVGESGSDSYDSVLDFEISNLRNNAAAGKFFDSVAGVDPTAGTNIDIVHGHSHHNMTDRQEPLRATRYRGDAR
jgi:hypothetical protein